VKPPAGTAVPLDPALNPGFLKLDLLCRGLRTSPSCEDGEGRPILRTRAGLGSGLELELPGRLFVNVPVLERFAQDSPYELVREPSGGLVVHRDGRRCMPVRLAPRPDWYDRRTRGGRPMRMVGTLQGTYLGIYPGRVCDFWLKGPLREAKENCHFCSVGLNLGADEGTDKTLDEVMDVVHAAWSESGITYVDLNGGHSDALDHVDVLVPLVERIKRETGLLVGVQVPPHPDPSRYARIRAAGANRISFCFELFDPEAFARTCPGKARAYGLDGYLRAIEQCLPLSRSGPRTEPWVVNGEIIAGLEPASSSIAAIEWLCARGAIPTACVFRPLRGTDLADASPPRTEDVLPVFQALWTRCMEAKLPIGLAPNVHVSLVMLPEECRWLVQDERALKRLRGQELVLFSLRAAYAGFVTARRAILGPRPQRAGSTA